MTRHSVFGIGGVAISDCARGIVTLLEVELSERESDYLACYLIGSGLDFKVKIVEQPGPEGELIEPGYPDLRILIYLDEESDFSQKEGYEISGKRLVRISGS